MQLIYDHSYQAFSKFRLFANVLVKLDREYVFEIDEHCSLSTEILTIDSKLRIMSIHFDSNSLTIQFELMIFIIDEKSNSKKLIDFLVLLFRNEFQKHHHQHDVRISKM